MVVMEHGDTSYEDLGVERSQKTDTRRAFQENDSDRAPSRRRLGTILSHTRRHRRLASRAPQGEAPRRRPSPTPTRTMSRPVTMNDLFADPEGCESTDDKTAKLASKAAGFERKGGSRMHIAKAAVQGEFGAKKFIKP